jgi:hypothetical protein
MFLSYSGWKLYDGCPRAYMYQYVTKPALPMPENKVNALFGTIVGKTFEIFFEKTLWKRPGHEEFMLTLGEKLLDRELNELVAAARNTAEEIKADPEEWARNAIRWKGNGEGQDPKANYVSREALLDDIKTAIPRGIEIVRQHGLTGAAAYAELKLDAQIGDHTYVGRADFVIAHENKERHILDGKGSRWGDKFLDETQLVWYSMLWRERTKRLPDRVGFILWRKEPDKAMSWVSLSAAEVDGLRAHLLEVVETIETGRVRLSLATTPEAKEALGNEWFPPHPGPTHCKLCKYLQICPTGKVWEESEKTTLPSTVSSVPADGTGVEDVGL